MKIVNRMLFGLALAGSLCAQTVVAPQGEGQPRQQRVFMLKYADARSISSVLEIFGYGIKANPDLHVVAVSAPPDAMAAVEDAIKRLDVPAAAPKDIDLVVYLMMASPQPSADGGLPPDLQPIADEVKKIFAYKSFRLLDSILLRTQPGNRATASGTIPTGDPETKYHFEVQPASVTEDPEGRLVRLNNLNLSMSGGNNQAEIRTEITVREGQRVVVGKSNMGTGGSLILVVTAKVTE